MTLTSMANPYYFSPMLINDKQYISGEFVAISPALLAYEYVLKKKKGDVSGSDIMIMSVGGVNNLPSLHE